MSQPNVSSNHAHPVSTSNFVVGPSDSESFVDRRSAEGQSEARGERRQFGSSHAGLTEDGIELATAIDHYKVQNHRRYLTCDEMLSVMRSLGYSKRAD